MNISFVLNTELKSGCVKLGLAMFNIKVGKDKDIALSCLLALSKVYKYTY